VRNSNQGKRNRTETLAFINLHSCLSCLNRHLSNLMVSVSHFSPIVNIRFSITMLVPLIDVTYNNVYFEMIKCE